MISDGIRWALERGRPVVPVLTMEWRARGSVIETVSYCPGGEVLSERFGRPKVVNAGFGPIPEGPSVESGGTIEAARTKVTLENARQDVSSFLARYDPKLSHSTIHWASPELVPADWTLLFDGRLDGWNENGPNLDLDLGSDDSELASDCPKLVVDKAAFSSAADPGVWGYTVPVLQGIHDSLYINGRGMAQAINVRYDEGAGRFSWLVSHLGLKQVRRIYFDGVLQSSGIWTMERSLQGGMLVTLVNIGAAYKPDKTVTVSVDADGPDATGGTSGATVTNNIEHARTFMKNYVFGDLRYGLYDTSPSPRLHETSWDFVSAFFAANSVDAGSRWGGSKDKLSGQGVMDSLLRSYRFLRAWWTRDGKIKLGFVPFELPLPPAAYVDLDKYARETVSHKTAPKVYTDVEVNYLLSHQEQRFVSTHVASDIGLLEQNPTTGAVLPIDNVWSQTRFIIA